MTLTTNQLACSMTDPFINVDKLSKWIGEKEGVRKAFFHQLKDIPYIQDGGVLLSLKKLS